LSPSDMLSTGIAEVFKSEFSSLFINQTDFIKT